jgi:dihydroflavonol-4-reductase
MKQNYDAESQVLVTGGSGFIAQHCMIALLNAGYKVRTTLRSPEREQEVRVNLKRGGADADARLAFVGADLTSDEGWSDAAAGCMYVVHGASPTPSGNHADEDDWIRPAVDGNLRVLRAARKAGVRRVVLTSAFGAIGVGHAPMNRPFNEDDWSVLSNRVGPYQKSKTLAEKAAWDFMASEGGGLELSAINPVAVLGPVLGPDYSHSIRLIKSMLDGQAGCPRVNSAFVDVRDVADLHLRAMTQRSAAGERFLASSGNSMWLVEVARVLRDRLASQARRVHTRQLPDWMVRIAAWRNPMVRSIVPLLGIELNATSEKAQRLLGWKPRPPEDAIVATARSLLDLKLVRV